MTSRPFEDVAVPASLALSDILDFVCVGRSVSAETPSVTPAVRDVAPVESLSNHSLFLLPADCVTVVVGATLPFSSLQRDFDPRLW